MPRDILADKEKQNSPRDVLAGKGVRDVFKKADTEPANFLNTSLIDKAVGFSVGGPTALGGGARNAEDALPVLMGAAGGFIGSRMGKPNVGIGIGTAIGDFEKQAIKKIKGDSDKIDVEDSLVLGALAAAGGKVVDVALKSVGMSTQLIPEKSRAALFEKSLQAVNIGKKTLSRNWNRAVNSLIEKFPDKRVDLSPVLSQLKKQFTKDSDNLIPQIKTAIGKNKRLLEAVDDPNKGIGFTLKEANEMKNAITSAIKPIQKKAIKGEILPTERVALEIADSFDDAITQSFPEMTSIRAAYREGRKAFKLARKLVEPGEAVEGAILSRPQGLFGLGGTPLFKSTQGRLATKDIMSRTKAGARLFEQLKLAHNLNRAADATGRLAEIAFGGALIRKLTKGDE